LPICLGREDGGTCPLSPASYAYARMPTYIEGRLSLSTDGVEHAVDIVRGDFIKGLILIFNIQNIVNFVMDVSVKFSVYKNPCNKKCFK